MRFFDLKRFSAYWFSTGTPTFLIETIRHRDCIDRLWEPIVVGGDVFDGYDPIDVGVIPLLFQTGYLTVKQMELTGGIPSYTLGIPNSEVKDALLKSLLFAFGKYRDDQIVKLHTAIKQQIINCDKTGFSRTLESMVAAVPSNLHIGCEAYYHSIMLMWLQLIGFEVRGEVPNNLGYSDLVW